MPSWGALPDPETYTPPPPPSPYGGYGAASYGDPVGTPTTVPYDATPSTTYAYGASSNTPVPVDLDQRVANNPAQAPMAGTSWGATSEQIAKADIVRGATGVDTAGWTSDMRNFQYGRSPEQATADVERARAMGQNAAAAGQTIGAGAVNYATGAAQDMGNLARGAGASGRGDAKGVAAAGGNTMATAQNAAMGLQGTAQTQAGTASSLGQGLTQQGALNQAALTQQGYQNQGALTQQGGALAGGINEIGRAAARSTAPATNALTDVAGRGIATGVTRANEMTGVGQNYANRLSSLENEQGPSGAQALLNQQNNRAMNTQLALARSGRGAGGNAAAIQQAGQNIGAIQQDAGNQASQLRAQEYAAWRGRQAQNLGAAANTDLGARQAGGALEQQAYGQGANAYSSAGNLNLAGVQTQLQGATQAAGVAQQGAVTGATLAQQAASTGAGLAQQNAQAGAGTTMQGQALAGDTARAAADFSVRGAEANTAATAQAAALAQQAYAQELAGYGTAAGVGLQGYGMGIDALNAATQNQLGFENQAYGVRGQEMQGGLALEDKYIRDYAITSGAQQAENAARTQREAGYLNAGAAALGAIA